jgi:hypothetical protein
MEGHCVSVLSPVTLVVSCHSTEHRHAIWLMENIEYSVIFLFSDKSCLLPSFTQKGKKKKKKKLHLLKNSIALCKFYIECKLQCLWQFQ